MLYGEVNAVAVGEVAPAAAEANHTLLVPVAALPISTAKEPSGPVLIVNAANEELQPIATPTNRNSGPFLTLLSWHHLCVRICGIPRTGKKSPTKKKSDKFFGKKNPQPTKKKPYCK
jgi:hypothetical protein